MDASEIAGATLEDSNRSRIVEATRTRTRRIEVADPIHNLVVREVAVAEDHDIGGLARERVDNVPLRLGWPRKNVRDEKTHAAERDARNVVAAPVVDVAFDVGHRRDPAQRAEYLFTANVTRMDDVVDARENVDHARMKHAMRVADQADAHFIPRSTPSLPSRCRCSAV